MLISPDQIRAARALKNWSQSELAERIDMATPSIGNIESGKHIASPKTQNAIIEIFEAAGIEFIDGGVRHRSDLLRILEEKDNENIFLYLLDDIYYTLREKKGETLWSFVEEGLSPPEVISKEKLIRESGIAYRNLIRHGDRHFIHPANEYRWLPEGYFLNNLTVVYGDKFALVVNKPKTHNVEKILIINDRSVAEMKRKEFEIIWNFSSKVA
jgi:transcriptional regulator with XRE-family HTH domain